MLWGAGFVAAVASVVWRGLHTGHPPMQNLFEFFLCMAAALWPLSQWSRWKNGLDTDGQDALLGALILFPAGFVFGEEVRRLPPAARADGVSFVVFNDIHSRPQLYPLLMAKAGARPDFAVFNGDVLQDPQSEREVDENLLQPMAWLTAQGVPCFFLRGNHETRGAFARQRKPRLVVPDTRYSSALTFGPARVLFLESGEDKPDTSKEYSGLVPFDAYIEEELAWLRRELAGEAFRRAAWRIAVVHIPPDWRVTEAELWHGQRRMRERFAPLFDEAKVDVVISGHNHKAALVEPCPDASRGFRWPVFIGGAHPYTNATATRVEADAKTL
jgi:predicted phosphodiesterase